MSFIEREHYVISYSAFEMFLSIIPGFILQQSSPVNAKQAGSLPVDTFWDRKWECNLRNMATNPNIHLVIQW